MVVALVANAVDDTWPESWDVWRQKCIWTLQYVYFISATAFEYGSRLHDHESWHSSDGVDLVSFIGNHISFWSKRSTVIYIDPSGSFQYIYIANSRSCRFESSLHSIKNESLDSCRSNGVRVLPFEAGCTEESTKKDNYCTWARSARALPSTNPAENFHQL